MDIRVLKYFLAVARESNITKAAESLHISQPSLSKQLMELEQELGKQLLIRKARKTELTQEGILLKARAEEILSLVEKTENDITNGFNEITGTLSIGGNIVESVIKTASNLQKQHPKIQFNFFSGDANDVTERLNHGLLDFAIMLEPVDVVKYDFISLKDSSTWGVLIKKDSPFVTKAFITKEDLMTMPLILHQRIGLQQEIAHWAKTDLEKLDIKATYNTVHGNPENFVLNDLGYFLTTRDLLPSNLADNICFLPLNPPIDTHYALVWKKHSVFSNVAKAFIECF